MPRRYDRTTKTDSVLRNVISRRRYNMRMGRLLIKSDWENTVGKLVADHSIPLSLKRGKLFLAVDSSPWMNELQFFTKEIIDNLNLFYGKEKVKEVRMKVFTRFFRTLEAPKEEELPELDSMDLDRIKKAKSKIKNQKLQEAFTKAYEASIARDKLLAEKKLEAEKEKAKKY